MILILTTIAIVFFTLSTVTQIQKTYVRKSADDISQLTIIFCLIGYAIMFYRAYFIGDMGFMVNYAVTFILYSILYYQTQHYKQ